MLSVKFYENRDDRGVDLTISSSVAKHRLYVDLLYAINEDTVSIKHPLNKDEYKKYQKELELIDDTLKHHDLLAKSECKYHQANLLFLVIEFNRKYKDLLAVKAQDARLNNMIDFLKLVKPLSPSQKQKVEISLVINNVPFTFKDQPLLSEMVINKVSGVLMNNISQLYPELWEMHLKRGGNIKAVKERATANSTLQNQAVADITKIFIAYLNTESDKLRNPKASTDKATLTSKQGAFIYDLLHVLKIYEPRDITKADTNGKEANYHGLRKLIERY
jgi:hypothetical protein